MKARYSDVSARPRSALVGSPFRNTVKKFEADLVRHHHVTVVSQAQARCATALFSWQDRTVALLDEARVFEGLRGMVAG